jgi:hypothetical protein
VFCLLLYPVDLYTFCCLALSPGSTSISLTVRDLLLFRAFSFTLKAPAPDQGRLPAPGQINTIILTLFLRDALVTGVVNGDPQSNWIACWGTDRKRRMRRKKKKGRSPAPTAYSSCASSARIVAPVVLGPPPSQFPCIGRSSEESASLGPERRVDASACGGGLSSGKRLGFPPDFVGSHSFPHFASRLSRLWSLPCSSRSSFCGGWFSSPFRPPAIVEEWPLPGLSAAPLRMDPKNRNPNWDRWGPKEAPQGSQSWGKNRSLSWRLKPGSGKPENKDDIPISSSGDGGQTGILKTPPPPILKLENEMVRRVFCQKCGMDGHHARECFKSLWHEICRKETHNTARCVLPKQNKPSMPIVGMAADGLGFYSSHFSKPLSNKPKRSFIGLVKIVEGLILAEDLEKDFGFHFPWGRTWKAIKCHSGFLMQFSSQERLDEMINFPELKMKLSGAKIFVSSWSSQAKPKPKLHSVWIVAENVSEIVAENVPEELQNYQAICELGSTIGAVEEVDILSLNSKEIVRFKVHVKSVAMIPPIIEVGVKPFLYDIFFKIDNITDEGWNDESINLGKRASVDRQGFGDLSFEKSGKKAKSGDEESGRDVKGKSPLKVSSVHVNVAGSLSEHSDSMKIGKSS